MLFCIWKSVDSLLRRRITRKLLVFSEFLFFLTKTQQKGFILFFDFLTQNRAKLTWNESVPFFGQNKMKYLFKKNDHNSDRIDAEICIKIKLAF